MVVYAEFEIPAGDLRIGRAFGRLSDVHVEMDRVVPTGDSIIPFIWVRGADPDEVTRAVRADHAVEDIDVLHGNGETTLFRVVWNRLFRDAIVEISESNLALLTGHGTTDAWRFEFRSVDKRPLSEFQAYLRDRDIRSKVLRLHGKDSGLDRALDRLTESQLEALQLAYERGYFDDARTVNLEPLAAELGITRQAFSGRLRRGMHTILAETFGERSA